MKPVETKKGSYRGFNPSSSNPIFLFASPILHSPTQNYTLPLFQPRHFLSFLKTNKTREHKGNEGYEYIDNHKQINQRFGVRPQGLAVH